MSITYLEGLPDTESFLPLLESTGWYRQGLPQYGSLTQALAQSWYAVSAYDGDNLVGFGRVLSDGVIHALIVELIVLPSHQRQGIGSAVLERLVARCTEHGIRSIQLFCADGKAPFYDRQGFVRRPNGAPGMDYRGS